MTKSEALKIIAFMAAHFSEPKISDEMENLWVRYLGVLPVSEARQASIRLMSKYKYKSVPPWSEFREEILLGKHLSASDAWADAWASVGVGSNEMVKDAIKACGGTWTFRTCSNPASLRKTFIDIYTRLLNLTRERTEKDLTRLARTGTTLQQLKEGKN